MIALTGLVGFISIIVAAAIMRGWVLSVMWGWFVVPTFGIAVLSIPVAIGIGLILSFTTHQTKRSSEPTRDLGVLAGNSLFYPLLLLGIAWIVKSFI